MKKAIAELIGTFALVFVGAGAASHLNESSGLTPAFFGLITVALAHGLTLAGMIYAVGHISGAHFNPAVTITMAVCGKIGRREAIAYIISQLIGAALAGFMLKLLFNTGSLGATTLAKGISPSMGLLCEAVGTFLILMVIFGAAVDGRTAGNMAGLAIGLTLAALIMVFGPFTGASFNPARTFGPALAAGQWDCCFWIYVVGPVVGGSLAGLVQTQVLMRT